MPNAGGTKHGGNAAQVRRAEPFSGERGNGTEAPEPSVRQSGYGIFVFVVLGLIAEALSFALQTRISSESMAVESADLIALLFLSVPSVYVARRLKRQYVLGRIILFAVSLVVLAQVIEFFDGQAWFRHLTETSIPLRAWTRLQQGLNMVGMTALVIAFIAALLSLQSSNERERAERRRLADQIAQRNRAEEARQESEAHLQGILSSLYKSAIVVYNRDGLYVDAYLSPEMERTLGVRSGDLVGRQQTGLMAPDDLASRQATIRGVFETGNPAQQTLKLDSGSAPCWIETNFAPMRTSSGEIEAVVGFVRDITEQQAMQAKLLENQARYRALFEGGGDALFVYTVGPDNVVSTVDEMNEQACRLFGYTREQLQHVQAADLCDPQRLDEINALVDRVMVSGHETMETRARHADGHTFPVEATVQRLELGGRPALLASIRDIRERKRREEELRQLATVVEQTGDDVIITDAYRVVKYVNPAFERSSGIRAGEVVGCRLPGAGEDPMNPETSREAWECVLGGETWRGHIHDRRRDGSPYEVALTLSPIHDARNVTIGYAAIRRDVTHEASLERQLRQAQKLEAIGTLAAGIAHDFKNTLSLVLGYAEMAMENAGTETARTYIGRIMKAGLRARGLIRQILIFSRQIEPERNPVQIQTLVDEALRLFAGSLPRTVHLHTELSPDSGVVLADPTQIHQVVLNLCTNACQALGDTGGEIGVTLRAATEDDLKAPDAPQTPGEYAMLEVRDSGQGVSPAAIDRIFDPFFTTKPPGEGAGLGLSVVHGIVTSLGGHIAVESAEGRGAVFRIFFPRTNSAPPATVEDAVPLPRGTESILVLDSEEEVARMTADVLRSLGYRATVFADAGAALEAVQREPGRYDGAIVDDAMPDASGLEFAREFTGTNGTRAVILATAFDHMPDLEPMREYGIRALLPKPFTQRIVATTVRQALDLFRDTPPAGE